MEQYSSPPLASSWSPDGSLLIFWKTSLTGTKRDICTLRLDGEPTVDPLIEGPFNQDDAAISPDGHWLAYSSDENGRWELYVWPFPDMKNRRGPISLEEGAWPCWAHHGKELFYLEGRPRLDMMMKVDIETEPTFTARNHQMLFQGKYVQRAEANRPYDVSLDGQRFLMIKEIEETDAIAAPTELMIVENWFETLKDLAPVKGEP